MEAVTRRVDCTRTFNKELETLNHVIRYARDVKSILLDNPAEKVRNRKTAATTVEIPSKEQFGRLLVELSNEAGLYHRFDVLLQLQEWNGI